MSGDEQPTNAPGDLPATRRVLTRIFGAHLDEAGPRTVIITALIISVIVVLQVVGLVVKGLDGDPGEVAGGFVGCAVFWTLVIVSLRGTA